MPAESSILTKVPKRLKEELDQKLIGSRFTGHKQLCQWLNDELEKEGLSVNISDSSFSRYAKKAKERYQEIAKKNEELEMLSLLANEKIFQALKVLAYDRLYDVLTDPRPNYQEEIKGLVDVIHSVSTLNRSDVTSKRYELEKEKRETLARELQQEVEQGVQKGGLSQEFLYKFEEMLGVPHGLVDFGQVDEEPQPTPSDSENATNG